MIIARANELHIELNQNKRIDVIAQNSEKFITFSFGACQFKDSFAFLTASLDKLVRLNKYEGNQKLKIGKLVSDIQAPTYISNLKLV